MTSGTAFGGNHGGTRFRGRSWAGLALVVVLSAVGLSMPRSAAAMQLPANDSGITGYFDTTVSMGAAMRVSGRDERLFSIRSGGKARSFNSDDGNLNYDRGDLVSLSAKVNHELQLSLENQGADLGLFGRVLYFYDQVVADGDTDHTPLTAAAKRHAGRDVKLLDAYATGDFDAGAMPVSVRLGNQVISWGESVFLRGGINSISPADISRLRVAGAELRDVLIPVPAANVKLGIGDSVFLEGFYQFRWAHTEVEAKGTFFSVRDIAGPGADTIHLGLGERGDDTGGLPDPRLPKRCQPRGVCALACRVPPTGMPATTASSAWPCATLRRRSTTPNWASTTRVFTAVCRWCRSSPATRKPMLTPRADYAGSMRYFREFPEDIDVVGASFNGELGSSGFAVQGEIAYRRNQPLQVDNAELVFSAYSPLRELAARAAALPPQHPAKQQLTSLAGLGRLFGQSQTGPVGTGRKS